MEQSKERNHLFDNIKALLIFFVVTSHFIRVCGSFDPADSGGIFYAISFSFMIQCFFFISGYFSKNTEKCRRGAFRNFLLPYLILMPLMYVCRLLIFGHATLDITMPSHALWFLLAMFIYRFSIKTLAAVPGIIFLGFASYLLSGCFSALDTELALGRIFSFFIFFITGFFTTPEHITKIRNVKKRYSVLILALLILFSYIVTESEQIPVEMLHLKDRYSEYGIGMLTGMLIRTAVAVASFSWIFVLLNLMPERRTFLSGIGSRTVTVYIGHIPFRYLVQHFAIPGNGTFFTYLICSAFAVLIIYVLSLPFVTKAYTSAVDLIYDRVLLRLLHPFASVRNRKRSA